MELMLFGDHHHKQMGFLLRKGSPYLPMINAGLMRLHEDGFIEELMQRHMYAGTESVSKGQVGGRQAATTASLRIGDLALAFIVYGAAILVSLLVALYEVSKKRPSRQEGQSEAPAKYAKLQRCRSSL